MEKFRIGHDLTVFWAINNNDGTPFILEGKDVRLFVTSPRGRKRVDIGIQGNVIGWDFLGRDQRYLGEYNLTVEVYAEGGKRAIKKDVVDAFSLVGNSCLECTDEDDANVSEGGELTLSSALDIYRIMPVVPQIGENGNWIVDGVDTGKPARGEAGSAVELAYVTMGVDENMNLNFDYVPSESGQTLEFELTEDGYLNTL